MKFFGTIAGVLIAIYAEAQYTSKPNGYFKVDNIRGCAPLTVNLTDLTGISGSFGIWYGAPPCVNFPVSPCSNTYTFTYTTPGTYTIKYNPPSIPGLDSIKVIVDAGTQPAFDIYSCAGDKVEVNITDKTYDAYFIDFNNDGVVDTAMPSGPNQTATFNYGAAGSNTIRVNGKKVNAVNNCPANSQPFNAVPTLPPPIFNTLDAVSSDTLQLGFTQQTNIQYQVEFAINSTTNFQVYKTLFATNSLTVPNLLVDNNYYCFRLNTHDPCANTNIASIPVCSQIFSMTPASGKNQLVWQTAGNISGIGIIRDGAPLATTPSPLPGASRQYDDTNVTCKINYTYQVQATYSNGAVSTSLTKSGTAFKIAVPPTIDNASAAVNLNQVQITWQTDPLFPSSRYIILKAADGTHYVNYANASTPDFTDANYDTNQPTCYRVNYLDDCDNVSALGQPICPVQLAGTLDAKNHISLGWSPYKGWKQGVKNYTLKKFNSSGSLVSSLTLGTLGFIDDVDDPANQVVSYSVVANPNEAGMSQSNSNIVTLVKGINLFSPTAFNPESRHSDNSTFIVKGQYISSLQLRIFDRWGTMIYSSDSDEPWDGKKDGSPMPTATYVWTAQGVDYSGREFKEAGTVLLIRHKN